MVALSACPGTSSKSEQVSALAGSTPTDFGQNWQRFLSQDFTSIQDIIVDGDTVYAASEFGLMVSKAGRDFWYPAVEGMGSAYVTKISLKDNILFAGTYSSSVWSRPISEIEVPPLDDDNDGIANDDDLCADTPLGAEVNSNGCAASQLDDDNDGVTNDIDLCTHTFAGAEVNGNGCAASQLDDDNDGVTNDIDVLCPNTLNGVIVNDKGCDLIASNAISIYAATPTCPNVDNGSIEIVTSLAGYSFDIDIVGEGRDENFTAINLSGSFKVDDLAPGSYEITVSIPSVYHEQLFGVVINEVNSISGKFHSTDTKAKTARYIVSGSTEYSVDINGIQKRFIFDSVGENEIAINNLKTSNSITISGKNDCQGTFVDTFSLEEEIRIYPTITSGLVSVLGGLKASEIYIYNTSGQLMSRERMESSASISLDNFTSGLYIVHIKTKENIKIFKVIKK